MVVISHVKLALVYGVDQLLDHYELNSNVVKPDSITINKETYEALLAFENDGKREPYMQLTHYRGVALKTIK